MLQLQTRELHRLSDPDILHFIAIEPRFCCGIDTRLIQRDIAMKPIGTYSGILGYTR